MPQLTIRTAALVIALWLSTAAHAQREPPTPSRTPGEELAWVDLRTNTEQAAALHRLWEDRLAAGRARAASAAPIVAYSSVKQLAAAGGAPALAVSFLFSMYDCELPGNGRGQVDMYARCPMRIVVDGGVKTHEGVCHLHVDPLPAGVPGPSPASNKTLVWREGESVRVRIVQHGKIVQGCESSHRWR